MRKNIRHLCFALIISFAILGLYMGYINIFMGPALATDPHNRRLAAREAGIHRGTIYDRRGEPLALTEDGERIYPLGEKAAHVIGFVSQRYGRTGLESVYDGYLLAMTGEAGMEELIDRLMGRTRVGNDITVTIDSRLQSLAMELLGDQRGAVAALDPATGAVLALASTPSFDPNILGQPRDAQNNYYETLQGDEDSPLLNRASQGAYPPGSVFKLVAGATALEADGNAANKRIKCRGSIEAGGFQLPDIAVHGEVDFARAMSVSCNSFFATVSMDAGKDAFYRTAQNFGLTKNPWEGSRSEIPYRPGSLSKPEEMDKAMLASSAIGQGEVLVNPLQMALITAAVANSGEIMRPYLLESVHGPSGEPLFRTAPGSWLTAMKPRSAAVIRDAMVKTVREGTGTNAAIPGTTVAGKTGSAQNPHGDAHAWFVAFAPAENPRIAVAVIVENGGTGGRAAAPIAREIIREELKSPVRP
ncbi:MAG: cell division protein FtsI [Clostridia bacterium]|nr:cell division protein FtsI [Clostridia bacterium]